MAVVTTTSASRNRSSSRKSTSTPSTRCVVWISPSPPPPRAMTKPRRCWKPSASRSATKSRERNHGKDLDDQPRSQADQARQEVRRQARRTEGDRAEPQRLLRGEDG